jgi:hypothetical protein
MAKSDDPVIEVSDRTQVEFILKDGRRITVSIRQERLRIESDRGLTVEPSARNLIFVR